MATTGPIAAALAAVQTAIDTATLNGKTTLERVSPFQVAPVRLAIDNALVLLNTRIKLVEAGVIDTSVAGVVAGGFATQLIDTFNGQFKLVRETAFLYESRAYLQRLRSNIYVLMPPPLKQVAPPAPVVIDLPHQGGGAQPTPVPLPSVGTWQMDFSDAENSGYVVFLEDMMSMTIGTWSMDFSVPQNSGYEPVLEDI